MQKARIPRDIFCTFHRKSTLMPRKRTIKLRCPICKKPVKNSVPEFPFCSPRCRTIDLGKWASGGYVVSSPVTDAEETVQDTGVQDQDQNREE